MASADTLKHDVVDSRERPLPVVVISLLSSQSGEIGGQEIRWCRLLHALETPEFDVRVLCTDTLVAAWKHAGLPAPPSTIRTFSASGGRLRTWIGAQLFLLRNTPGRAVVQLTGPGMMSLPGVMMARWFNRCRILTSITAARILPHLEAPWPRKGYWLFRTALGVGHVVDVLNPRTDVPAIVPRKPLRVAPCSFSDPVRFTPAPEKRRRVAFVGHLDTHKGSDLLQGALRIWPDEWELVLCGNGAAEQALRKAADDRDNITITRRTDVENVLADASVFLSLQIWDNYPSQSLLEAMLAECLVVATDVGDTDLLVRDEWGVRIPGDASGAQLVAAVRTLMDLPEEERSRRGQLARRFVLEHHTIEQHAAYVQSLWRELHHG